MRRLHLMTVVWGVWHREMFLRVALPSILSPGNLVALKDRASITYTIYTSAADAEIIRRHPLYVRLGEICAVSLAVRVFNGGSAYAIQHKIRAIDSVYARSEDAYCVTVQPDVVYSDGVLPFSFDAFLDHGIEAVYFKVPRVVGESVLPELMKHAAADGGVLSLDARAVADLAVRHPHPLMFTQCTSAPNFANGFSECLVEPVLAGGHLEGFVIGTLFPSDVMFWYANSSYDLGDNQVVHETKDFSRLMLIDGSEQVQLLSLVPLTGYAEWYLNQGPYDGLRVANIIETNSRVLSPAFADHRVRVCSRERSEKAWRDADRRLMVAQRRQVRLAEYLRVWKTMRREGLEAATTLLAYAMHQRSWLQDLGPAARILVPDDTAINRRFGGHVPDRTEFRRFLARHVNAELGNARILRSDLMAGTHRLCVIDRVLDF